MTLIILIFYGRLFFDEEIRCLEYNSVCSRDGYHQFLNDDNNPPDNYETVPEELYDPPNPFPHEENDVT